LAERIDRVEVKLISLAKVVKLLQRYTERMISTRKKRKTNQFAKGQISKKEKKRSVKIVRLLRRGRENFNF
jgi:ferric-dicitrate binding protein FerR (iron transport regulator)